MPDVARGLFCFAEEPIGDIEAVNFHVLFDFTASQGNEGGQHIGGAGDAGGFRTGRDGARPPGEGRFAHAAFQRAAFATAQRP